MKVKILTLGLICLALIACENPHSNNPSKLLGLPEINYFTATPSLISYGESSTLSWSVSNAVKVVIDQDIGEVPAIGAMEVSPRVKKITYVLTATNNNEQIQKSCTIEVTIGPANVVMISGPSIQPGGAIDRTCCVIGVVKNTGTGPALNLKVSLELYGSSGNLLASGECMVSDGRLEPQKVEIWMKIFDDPDLVLYWGMVGGEIKYEITWDELTSQ